MVSAFQPLQAGLARGRVNGYGVRSILGITMCMQVYVLCTYLQVSAFVLVNHMYTRVHV